MASADGTHLFGHQKRLPNQPQLYQIQLDLDHHEHDIKPAETSSIAIASTAADAARTASGMNRAVAVDGEHVLVTGHAGRPQHSSTCAARFSLLAPEYSSDMPVSNKAYFGMLLMLEACVLPTCRTCHHASPAAQCRVAQH